jgi:hypothetical protein
MTSISAVRRALVWLETQGYLSIITKDPTMTIRLLGKSHPYLHKRETAKAKRHTPPKEPGTPVSDDPKDEKPAQDELKTGTPPTQTDTPEKPSDINAVDAPQNAPENETGTPPTQTGTPLKSVDNSSTACNHDEKNTDENAPENKPAHFRDFSRDISNAEERERHKTPSSQTDTRKQAHTETGTHKQPKAADRKKSKKDSRAQRTTDQEYDTAPKPEDPQDETPHWKAANLYAEGYRRLTGLERAKMPVRAWKDDFRRLQEINGWSLEQMGALVEARWAHPYFGNKPAHPWTLQERYGNSDNPWMEILIWMKKQDEKPKADPRKGNIPYVDENGVTWLNGHKLISKNS